MASLTQPEASNPDIRFAQRLRDAPLCSVSERETAPHVRVDLNGDGIWMGEQSIGMTNQLFCAAPEVRCFTIIYANP